MSWRTAVLRLMRVPGEPEVPFGGTPRTFRAARNFLTLKIVRWAFAQAVMLIGLVVMSGVMEVKIAGVANPSVVPFLRAIYIAAWAFFLLQFLFGWAVMRLDYELRWYILTDRAIRIREGIGTVREKTIALANIQNIEIRQGPLQRLLRIADLEVKTAGGGATAPAKGKQHTEPLHVAFFRGVDNAEAIRDLVREGVRRQKGAGLGDLDDEHESDDALHAAQALLEETRRVRAALTR
jgi:membrane protein YdbS with pleckstrin-like domain